MPGRHIGQAAHRLSPSLPSLGARDLRVLEVDPGQRHRSLCIVQVGIEPFTRDDDGAQILLRNGQCRFGLIDRSLRLKHIAVCRIGRALRRHTARQQGIDYEPYWLLPLQAPPLPPDIWASRLYRCLGGTLALLRIGKCRLLAVQRGKRLIQLLLIAAAIDLKKQIAFF